MEQPAKILAKIKAWFRFGGEQGKVKSNDVAQIGYRPPELSPAECLLADRLRQGDVGQLESVPVLGREVYNQLTPHGVVLLTQTCDAVRPEKLTVLVAPLVSLDGSPNESGAIKNRVLRYVHVPHAGQSLFADLHSIVTLEKSFFLGLGPVRGLDQNDDDAVRRFGRAVGRRFARFPFPNEVVPWLKPLEDIISNKHDGQGNEGAALREVVEFRVEVADNWETAPRDLTLYVIVKPATLPSFPDGEEPIEPKALTQWLAEAKGKNGRKSSEIADKLSEERAKKIPSPDMVYWLWMRLAESWASQCVPDQKRISSNEWPAVRGAVDSIEAQLLETLDFSLERYRNTEQLDLDHLSSPPLG